MKKLAIGLLIKVFLAVYYRKMFLWNPFFVDSGYFRMKNGAS